MKRLRLKKSVIHFLIIIICLGVETWFILNYGQKFFQEKIYKNNYESDLVEHGFTTEEAKELIKLFDDDKLDVILINEPNSKIIELAKEKYFIFDNLSRYISYYDNNPTISLKDVIALVNTKNDLEKYPTDLASDVSLNKSILVNKYYSLPEDYIPENLVPISNSYAYDDNKVTSEAYEAFINMWNKANEDGWKLIINSSYRSYASQKEVYDDYVKRYGTTKAEELAARPGFSEHQTGLAIDVFEMNNQLTSTFKDSEAYTWLKENAYLYGFIERYPEGKENITGYSAEAWHWRYVGEKIAKVIHDEDITFDEYYAYYIENQA